MAMMVLCTAKVHRVSDRRMIKALTETHEAGCNDWCEKAQRASRPNISPCLGGRAVRQPTTSIYECAAERHRVSQCRSGDRVFHGGTHEL